MARIYLGIASSDYDDYERLPKLSGAAIDGQNVAEALLNDSIGQYDLDLSRVLVSPTLSEIYNVINEILFLDDRIECFTLYFAGHGISQNGAYYLCARDTNCNRISATALALNHIFNVINDVQPLQSNIIIDACQAGGFIGDLGSLIKQEVFGYKNSPSVSLFGSALRDQEARENHSGGFATQALMRYIKGEVSIDTLRPYLDLVYIGRCVSDDIMDVENNQTPVVWGFNLTGMSTFVRNRNFNLKTSSTAINMPTFLSTDLELVQNEKEKIWYEYLKITENGPTPELVHTLVRSVNDLKLKDMDPIKIASFLIGTAEGLAMRVSNKPDLFAEAETLASCLTSFLPIIEEKDVEYSFISLLDRLLQNSSITLKKLDSELNNPNFLMSNRAGIADLYFLPIRISKVLGWIGLLHKIQKNLGLEERISTSLISDVILKVTDNYKQSFVSVSGEQSPYIYIYSQLATLYDDEKFLIPIKSYFDDFVTRKGKISIALINGEQVLSFLYCRKNNEYSTIRDIMEQPTELLSVLLYAAAKINIDNDFDTFIKNLDYLPFNIFIPDAISYFSEEQINNGTNITMQVGMETDYGVFTVDDFRNNFAQFCLPKIESLIKGKKQETIIATGLASFMLPDRVPWLIT